MNGSRYDEEERTLGISPFKSNNRIIMSIEELERSDKKSFEATSVDWDLVIVDEAHHLEWTPEEPSLKWHFVNEIAKKAETLGIKKLVFDKSGYKFHGRIKIIADELRSKGLNF